MKQKILTLLVSLVQLRYTSFGHFANAENGGFPCGGGGGGGNPSSGYSFGKGAPGEVIIHF